jgi:hypothetical protein
MPAPTRCLGTPAQVTPEANGTAHITTPDSRGSKAEEAPCCVITKPLPDAPYTGSCAPLCELQRKKHLDELNILDTVRLVLSLPLDICIASFQDPPMPPGQQRWPHPV